MSEVQAQSRRVGCNQRRSAIFEEGFRPTEAASAVVPVILGPRDHGSK